jgi:hypothetical protein
MKSLLLLSAALLLAGTAHAQGGLSGSSLSPVVINATPIQPYGKIVRQCNCTVTSARNDGPFDPSAFENYDQAVQEGELALKDGQPGIAEVARLYRKQKKVAPQTVTLVAIQDNRGRVVFTSQKP